MSGSRRLLAGWLLARRRAVGPLVSIGIETAAGGMAVSTIPRSRTSGKRWDRDSCWRDGYWKTLCSRATYLALMSGGIETAAGGMAVGKALHSRSTGERRDRDSDWRDGWQQDATQ